MADERPRYYVADCTDCGRIWRFSTRLQRGDWHDEHPGDHEVDLWDHEIV